MSFTCSNGKCNRMVPFWSSANTQTLTWDVINLLDCITCNQRRNRRKKKGLITCLWCRSTPDTPSSALQKEGETVRRKSKKIHDNFHRNIFMLTNMKGSFTWSPDRWEIPPIEFCGNRYLCHVRPIYMFAHCLKLKLQTSLPPT